MTESTKNTGVERSRLALLGALAASLALAGCGHRAEVAGTEQWQDNARTRNRFIQTGEFPPEPAPDPRTSGGGGGGGGGGH